MGERYIVRGALVKCSAGASPTKLNLPKSHGMYANGKPLLNEGDAVAGSNVMPFGKCKVLNAPCAPVLAAQWEGTKGDTLIKGRPALLLSSTLTCAIGGGITIKNDGQ